MKSALKNVAGLALVAVLAVGMFSCKNGAGDDDSGKKQSSENFVKVTGRTVVSVEDTDNEEGFFTREGTTVVKSFYIGKYEVTQVQYKSVMSGQKVTVDGTEYTLNDSPSICVQGNEDYMIESDKSHANHPVENITWFDAVYYCNALSKKENFKPCYTIKVIKVNDDGHIIEADVTYDKTKNGYRLPTEAEWEYAARGGDPEKPDWNYTYSGADKAANTNYNDDRNSGLDSVGWYCFNNITGTTGDSDVTGSSYGCGTHEVGQKKANALGIYDMSGNVFEWCYNQQGDHYAELNTVDADENRIIRGGSWYEYARCATVTYYYFYAPGMTASDLGFRVVRNAD